MDLQQDVNRSRKTILHWRTCNLVPKHANMFAGPSNIAISLQHRASTMRGGSVKDLELLERTLLWRAAMAGFNNGDGVVLVRKRAVGRCCGHKRFHPTFPTSRLRRTRPHARRTWRWQIRKARDLQPCPTRKQRRHIPVLPVLFLLHYFLDMQRVRD